jgi:hypothetical protein
VAIYQAVMLVSTLQNLDNQPTTTIGSVPVIKQTKDTMIFGLKSDSKDFKVGQTYEIAVMLKSPKMTAIDGADIFVKFDTAGFDVSDLKQVDGLPTLAYKNISKATGMISAGLYISAKEGLVLNEALEKKLVTFKIKPKMAGKFAFNLTTRNDSKEFATMIVETQTKKVVPFVVEQLQINVSK